MQCILSKYNLNITHTQCTLFMLSTDRLQNQHKVLNNEFETKHL